MKRVAHPHVPHHPAVKPPRLVFAIGVLIFLWALIASGPWAFAQEVPVTISNESLKVEPAPAPLFNSGDTAWMLTASALVLLMTVPGLALFYGGMVRKKNVVSAIYYSFGAAVIVSVLWVVVQYSLSFGGKDMGSGALGGFQKMFFLGVGANSVYPSAPTIPESIFSMFQLTFAIITVALISGAVVERMKFDAWAIFVGLWSLLVYAPLAHWLWNPDGWLAKLGALDFAGGLVVHTSSGVAALVAVKFIGAREGYMKEHILPHNVAFTFIGACLLWVGWFGFNAGSATSAGALSSNAWLVTNTAAATASLMWMIIERIVLKKPSIVGGASGVVAGLVAITPASGFVDVRGALVIGAVAGMISYLFVAHLKRRFGYDDSLDVFGIHATCGAWGALATGIFANPAVNPAGKGALFGNPGQIWIQFLSLGAAVGIAVLGTALCLFITKLITPLRAKPDEEESGLDDSMHGEAMLDQ